MVLLALYSWLSSFFHDPLEDQVSVMRRKKIKRERREAKERSVSKTAEIVMQEFVVAVVPCRIRAELGRGLLCGLRCGCCKELCCCRGRVHLGWRHRSAAGTRARTHDSRSSVKSLLSGLSTA